MNESIKVNDGKGLYDSEGMIDSLILDCNNNVKALVSGNYIAFCNGMTNMVRKLSLLKDGIQKDTAALQEEIHQMSEQLRMEEGGQVGDP